MRIGPRLNAIVLISALTAFLLPGTYVRATIIEEYNVGTAVTRSPDYLGQSVTTPSGVGWNNILFSFLKDTSVAYGTLFLLDQEYLGAPTDLGSTTPGYLAETSFTISGGFGDKWIFEPSVVLSPNTQYYFYSDYLFPASSTWGSTDNGYPEGMAYFARNPDGDQFYSVSVSDARFRLEGTPIPEPATMLLLGSGLVGLAGFRKKFKKK